MHTFTAVADIDQALNDPHLVPLPAQDGPYGTMPWLRATVARFSHGDVHARRRAYVEAELAHIDPEELGRIFAETDEPDDRRRVVRAVATAMAIADLDIEAVLTVADNYFGGDDPEADKAVEKLLPGMNVADPEQAANRIGILVQACDATATLIANTRAGSAEPPVKVMRRRAIAQTRVGGVIIAAGELVLLEVAAVGLTFGAGPRVCPGRAHALAISAVARIAHSE